MTYMDMHIATRMAGPAPGTGSAPATREALVLVVEDQQDLSEAFGAVCDCLDIAVRRMLSHDDLGAALQEHRPMAVVAQMDAAGQDGCHVLMRVAEYDRELPVLLITGDDGALLGAIDAVEEIWQLSTVLKWPQLLGVGAMVDFLFRAGRRGGSLGLLPI